VAVLVTVQFIVFSANRPLLWGGCRSLVNFEALGGLDAVVATGATLRGWPSR